MKEEFPVTQGAGEEYRRFSKVLWAKLIVITGTHLDLLFFSTVVWADWTVWVVWTAWSVWTVWVVWTTWSVWIVWVVWTAWCVWTVWSVWIISSVWTIWTRASWVGANGWGI